MRNYEDPYNTPEYEQFVADMAKHCSCQPYHRPCDGVLAGGICDGMGQSMVMDEDDDI